MNGLTSIDSQPRCVPPKSHTLKNYGCEIHEIDSCLVAAFSGEFTTASYSKFRDDYNEICRRLSEVESQRLVIDLTNVRFFGSLFVGMVVKTWVSIQARHGQMALCGLSDQLNDLMKKLLLLERKGEDAGRLKHFATRTAALEAIAAAG